MLTRRGHIRGACPSFRTSIPLNGASTTHGCAPRQDNPAIWILSFCLPSNNCSHKPQDAKGALLRQQPDGLLKWLLDINLHDDAYQRAPIQFYPRGRPRQGAVLLGGPAAGGSASTAGQAGSARQQTSGMEIAVVRIAT